MGARDKIVTAWRKGQQAIRDGESRVAQAAREEAARQAIITEQATARAATEASEKIKAADGVANAEVRAARARDAEHQQRITREETAAKNAEARADTAADKAHDRQKDMSRHSGDETLRLERERAAAEKAAKESADTAAKKMLDDAADARKAAADHRMNGYSNLDKNGKLKTADYNRELAKRMEDLDVSKVKSPEDLARIHSELADFMRSQGRLVPNRNVTNNINDPFAIEARVRRGGTSEFAVTEGEFASLVNLNNLRYTKVKKGEVVSDFALRKEIADQSTHPVLGFHWKNPITWFRAAKNLLTGSRAPKTGLEDTPRIRGIGLTPGQVAGTALAAAVGYNVAIQGTESFIDGVKADAARHAETNDWTFNFAEQVAHTVSDRSFVPIVGRPDFKVTPKDPEGKDLAPIEINASGYAEYVFNKAQSDPKSFASLSKAVAEGRAHPDLAGYVLRAQGNAVADKAIALTGEKQTKVTAVQIQADTEKTVRERAAREIEMRQQFEAICAADSSCMAEWSSALQKDRNALPPNMPKPAASAPVLKPGG